jgi:hypothetical protein
VTKFAGLDVGGKTTAICNVNTAGKIVWHGMADTHPDAIAARLKGLHTAAVSRWDEGVCRGCVSGSAGR